MVPLAIGSQTNGSTIRPAAYCGVVGFKPTHGLISRHGVFALSRTLDHVGLFANSVDDIALLAEQSIGYDENDPDTQPRAQIPFSQIAAEEPPLAPMFAFIKTPILGARRRRHQRRIRRNRRTSRQPGRRSRAVSRRPADAWQWHQTIMSAEMALQSRARMDERPRSSLGTTARADRARPRSEGDRLPTGALSQIDADP